MSVTYAQVWEAYHRVWGRIEGRGYRVRYTDKGEYVGCVWWDRQMVEIRRWASHADEHPMPADIETVSNELCVLCHELAHIEGKLNDESNWIYYFGVLNQWGIEQSGPPSENRARIIYAEEERAEREGRRILRKILPDMDLLVRYDKRAEESLLGYRQKLGLPEKKE